MDEPIILASAYRHGYGDDSILHAYRNAIDARTLDDLTILVGPDNTGTLLEIGVTTGDDARVYVIHAMKARPKFLR